MPAQALHPQRELLPLTSNQLSLVFRRVFATRRLRVFTRAGSTALENAPALHPQSDPALLAPSRRLALQSSRAGTPSPAMLGRMLGLATVAAGLGVAAWFATPSPASLAATHAPPAARSLAWDRSAGPHVETRRVAFAAP